MTYTFHAISPRVGGVERSPGQCFKSNFWDSLLIYTKYIATPKNQKIKFQNFQKTKKANLLEIQ